MSGVLQLAGDGAAVGQRAAMDLAEAGGGRGLAAEAGEAALPRSFSDAQPIPFRDVLQRVQSRIRRTRTQGEVDAPEAGGEQANG